MKLSIISFIIFIFFFKINKYSSLSILLQRKAELIEVKPRAQVTLEVARSQKEKASVILNMAKWEAAKGWCKSMGCSFRIITEEDLFNKASPNRTRRK